MATKSFITEFKFGKKSSNKLISAIENSKKVDHTLNQRVSNVTQKEDINKMMNSFLGNN